MINVTLQIQIPLAYTIWLYLLAVTYEIIEELGCLIFCVVEITTFSFISAFEIGCETENPYGYVDSYFNPADIKD